MSDFSEKIMTNYIKNMSLFYRKGTECSLIVMSGVCDTPAGTVYNIYDLSES